MWHRGKRERDSSEPVISGLVVEAEAFLSGHYEELLCYRGDRVPLWAHLNSCAHGDLATLQGVLATSSADGYFLDDRWELMWRRARRMFVQELLDKVEGDERRLCQIQRVALVPLELELIAEEAAGKLHPAELVRSFRAALRAGES